MLIVSQLGVLYLYNPREIAECEASSTEQKNSARATVSSDHPGGEGPDINSPLVHPLFRTIARFRSLTSAKLRRDLSRPVVDDKLVAGCRAPSSTPLRLPVEF